MENEDTGTYTYTLSQACFMGGSGEGFIRNFLSRYLCCQVPGERGHSPPLKAFPFSRRRHETLPTISKWGASGKAMVKWINKE